MKQYWLYLKLMDQLMTWCHFWLELMSIYKRTWVPWGWQWAMCFCQICERYCRDPEAWRTGKPWMFPSGLQHVPAGSTGSLRHGCPSCSPPEGCSGRSDAAVHTEKPHGFIHQQLQPNRIKDTFTAFIKDTRPQKSVKEKTLSIYIHVICTFTLYGQR